MLHMTEPSPACQPIVSYSREHFFKGCVRNLSTLGWLHDSLTRPVSPCSRGDDGSDAERQCAKSDGIRSRTAGEGFLKIGLYRMPCVLVCCSYLPTLILHVLSLF